VALSREKQQKMTCSIVGAAVSAFAVVLTAMLAARSAGKRYTPVEMAGKSDGGKSVRRGKLDRTAIAGGQQVVLTIAAAIPYRTDGMDDVFCFQAISAGDLGATGHAAIERAAFGEQLRPRGTMDRTVDAASAEERRICGVDDGVNA